MNRQNRKEINNRKAIIILLIFAFLIVTAFSISKIRKVNLLNRREYKQFCAQLEEASEVFTSQDDMMNFISSWADDNDIPYKTDSFGNIIITEKESSLKKKNTPTAVLVGCNYENALNNRRAIATAALLARTELNSGRKTVVFVNNLYNDGKSWLALNRKIFPDNAKVIYLDCGKTSYISRNSFERCNQKINIPFEKKPASCDTLLKIHIGGLRSNCIDYNMNKYSNPIMLLSTVLTRLNNKSTKYQLANLEVKYSGDMYPSELNADILLNYYSVASFTAYLQKRIDKFYEDNKDSNPDAFYTYEIIDDTSKYPEEVYSEESSKVLTAVLYTIKNGLYRFNEGDIIPDGYEQGDLLGLNCVNSITINEQKQIMSVGVSSQAVNHDCMETVKRNNELSAVISNADYKTVNTYSGYSSEKDSLLRTLEQTYVKVSRIHGGGIDIGEERDSCFTPMTYLKKINPDMDIVHVRESSQTAEQITNMLLCYIKTKGNLLSF